MAVTENRTGSPTRATSARRRPGAGWRFPGPGPWRWIGVALGALLVAALLTLYFLDWNRMRGPVSRYLSHRMGREVRIGGNLDVKLFSWQPSVDMGGLYIGNPAWTQTRQAAQVQRLHLEARLVPLIFGHLVLPVVRIDRPDISVVRDPSGRTNWDGGNGDAWQLPPIRRFVLNDGHLDVQDAVRKLHFTGTVSSREVQGRQAAFTMTGDGTLNTNSFHAQVQGGPLLHVDTDRPYDFTADIQAGKTQVAIQGRIAHPFHLDRYGARVRVTGPNLADLYFLTGLVLPRTPPYQLRLSVDREGAIYRLTGIDGALGGTDLSGDLTVDTSGAAPRLTGRVVSRVLNFTDLGALVGGGPAAPRVSPYLLPDTELHTERLRQTDAEVDYTAAAIRSRDFPLKGLKTHISLEQGVLDLKPLSFDFTQGRLSGALKIDARKTVPVTSMDARLTDLKAENFIKSADKPIHGTLEARGVLTGTGNSVHKAASTAGGTFTAVVPTGGMRHSLAEWTGVNVLSALGLTLAGDNSDTGLRCAVAHFEARQGVLSSRTFVIDTDPVRIDGSGTIDLRDETLSLKLQGKPKNFQFVRLRAPITVTGKLAHPALGIEAGSAIAQGGIAAALGLLNPLASILAFIDPGLAKDANCAPLLQTAKAQGAPVKAQAIRKAPAPRN